MVPSRKSKGKTVAQHGSAQVSPRQESNPSPSRTIMYGYLTHVYREASITIILRPFTRSFKVAFVSNEILLQAAKLPTETKISDQNDVDVFKFYTGADRNIVETPDNPSQFRGSLVRNLISGD